MKWKKLGEYMLQKMLSITALTLAKDGKIIAKNDDSSSFKYESLIPLLDQEGLRFFDAVKNDIGNKNWLKKRLTINDKQAWVYFYTSDPLLCFILDDDKFGASNDSLDSHFDEHSNLTSLKDDYTYVYDCKRKEFTSIYKGKEIYKLNVPFTENLIDFFFENYVHPDDRNIFYQWISTFNNYVEPYMFYLRLKFDNTWILFEIKGKQGISKESTRIILGNLRSTSKIVDSENISVNDPLTGLSNKTEIVNIAKSEIARRFVTKDESPYVLAIVDLDNFKQINDKFGHAFGDQVLCEAAEKLKKIAPEIGQIGRIGGDEFLILLDKLKDVDDLPRTLHQIEEIFFSVLRGKVEGFFCSCTIGASCYPRDAQDYNTLFLMADKALYRGKRKGKSCYVIYTIDKTGPVDSKVLNPQSESVKSIPVVGFIKLFMQKLINIAKGKETMRGTLAIVGEQYLLDRIMIYRLQDESSLETVYSWSKNESEDSFDLIEHINKEARISYLNKISSQDLYVNGAVESLRDNDRNLYDYLFTKRRIKALLAKGVFDEGGRLIYLIEYQGLTKKRLWNHEECNVLGVTSEILSLYLTEKTFISRK